MITLPETDLVVHPLCLGSNIFGSNADAAQSHAVLHAYRNHGGNFIDTADAYNQWVDGHVGGESETIIGSWLKEINSRAEIVIATKGSLMKTRPGLSAENIFAACEESLNRLQTDYIDLYYSHGDDPDVPMEEVLGAYAQLIAQGKVRYIAASNFSPERLRLALEISRDNNLPSYVAVQDKYNLVDRASYENNMAQTVAQFGLSNIPFYGIARGFLSGKYRPGVTEVDSLRAAGALEYANDKNFSIVAALDTIAASHNASVSAIALAWLRQQPTVSTPIASARTVDQLNEIIRVVELSDEELALLSALSL